MLGLNKGDIQRKIEYAYRNRLHNREDQVATLIAEGVADAIEANNKMIEQQLRKADYKL